MKKPAIFAIALLTGVVAAQGADRFKLDFDNGGAPSPTQTGWEAFTETADANNKSASYSGYTDLASGDITITTSGVQFTRNYDNTNTAAPDFPGTDLDRVYNDLILRNSTAATLNVSIAGLKAGTYQITTYHLVQAISSDRTAEFDLHVQDADSPSFSQWVGNFSMGKAHTTTGPIFAPTAPTFTVTSNGTDPIILRLTGTYLNPQGGTLNWFGINGLEVRVPPPAFQLDFDNSSPAPPGNTQSGWEAFSETGDQNNKTLNYPGYPGLASDNITITTSGVQFTRNYNNANTAAPDFPGTDLDRVYNDLILRDTAGALDITVEGLKAGTYQFTTHHLTQGTVSSVSSTFSLSVEDADSPAFGQDVGTFSMGKGNNSPLYCTPTAAVFDVTSNGIDPVIVRITTGTFSGGGQGSWIGINGLEILPLDSSTEFQLVIAPNAGNPGNYDFFWNSLAGKVYDLVSATDLDSSPAMWTVWNDNADIAATPGTNSLINIPGGGDPKRFFAVVEKDAP